MLYNSFEDTDNDLLFMHSYTDLSGAKESFEMHTHDCYEILYVFSGKGSYKIEGTEYSVSGNSMFITRISEAHCAQIDFSVDYERVCIRFSDKTLKHIDPTGRLTYAFNSRALGSTNQYRDFEFQNIDMESLFRRMTKSDNDSELQKITVYAALPILLLAIYDVFITKNISDEIPTNIENTIVRYVNRHLTENISLEEIGKEFFISTSQVNRIFKKSTGNTLWKYVIIKRLMLARQMIRKGGTLSGVYKECGFNDYSSFYRAYVKYLGATPQRDRAKIK